MGCVPPGFFIRLAALMAESDLFQLHFKRYGKIFRDFIPYKYHECFEVTIFEPPSIHSIHVDVAVHNHYRKSLADTCQSLRKDLYRMCKTACNRWLPTIEPHFAFICEKHNNEKDEEYFTSLDVEEGNKDTLVCESCSSPVNTTEEYNYWLSPQPLNTQQTQSIPTPDIPLTIDDLLAVKTEVISVAHKWNPLGLVLGLGHSQLERLKKDHSDAEDCLQAVLVEWLKKSYDTTRCESPSWKVLAEAVHNNCGGNNPALAEQISQHGRSTQGKILNM